MAYFRCGGAGIPASIKNDMNSVLNKKFGTVGETYPPTEWADDVNLMGVLPIRTATGAIASFSDGADDVPIKSGIFAINPYQEGSGDPSPSNPRAIHGFTGMNVTRVGENLYISSTSTYGQYLDSNGDIQTSSSWYISDFIPINGKFVYDGLTTTDNAPYSCFYDDTKTFLSSFKQQSGNNEVTPPNNAAYVRFSIFASEKTNLKVYELNDAPLVYPISWQTEAGTVYCGELNATTGLLTVTHGKTDFSELNWVLSGSGTSARWRSTSIQSLIQKPASISQILDMTMEQFLPINYGATLANYPDYMSALNTGELISYAYDTVNKPKGLCIYPLATSTEVQLTPTEIRTLLGTNNIYHDGNGSTAVEYRADTNLLIASLEGNRGLQMMRATPTEETETEEATENEDER